MKETEKALKKLLTRDLLNPYPSSTMKIFVVMQESKWKNTGSKIAGIYSTKDAAAKAVQEYNTSGAQSYQFFEEHEVK